MTQGTQLKAALLVHTLVPAFVTAGVLHQRGSGGLDGAACRSGRVLWLPSSKLHC
jgi:hypothetical protein